VTKIRIIRALIETSYTVVIKYKYLRWR